MSDPTFGFAFSESWQLPALEHLYGVEADEIDLAHTRWTQTEDCSAGAFRLVEFDTYLTLTRLRLCPLQPPSLADAVRRRLAARESAGQIALDRYLCPGERERHRLVVVNHQSPENLNMRTYAIYQHGFYATQALAHTALKTLAHIPGAEFVELEIPTDKNSVLALLNSEPLDFEVIDRFRLTPRGGFVRIDPSEPRGFVAGNGPKAAPVVADVEEGGDDTGDEADAPDGQQGIDLADPTPARFKPRIGGPTPIEMWSQVFGIDFSKNPPLDPHRPAGYLNGDPMEPPKTTAAATPATPVPEAEPDATESPVS